MTYNIIDVIITLASNSFEDTKLHEIYFADISLFLFLIKKEVNVEEINFAKIEKDMYIDQICIDNQIHQRM